MRRLETRDWWPELLAVKDDLSLRELAERFDVTPGAISAALKRTGVRRAHAPPGPRAYRKGKGGEELPPEAGDDLAAGARPRSKDVILESNQNLLGQIPDTEVARRLDVSARTVANYRARYGIAAYSGAQAAEAQPQEYAAPRPAAAPAQHQPVRSGGSMQAWKVTIRSGADEVSRVVLGHDLVDAATRAREAKITGQVVGLSLVGDIL